MKLDIERKARRKRALMNGTMIDSRGRTDRRIIKEVQMGFTQLRLHATKGWRKYRMTTGSLDWAMHLPRV